MIIEIHTKCKDPKLEKEDDVYCFLTALNEKLNFENHRSRQVGQNTRRTYQKGLFLQCSWMKGRSYTTCVHKSLSKISKVIIENINNLSLFNEVAYAKSASKNLSVEHKVTIVFIINTCVYKYTYLYYPRIVAAKNIHTYRHTCTFIHKTHSSTNTYRIKHM